MADDVEHGFLAISISDSDDSPAESKQRPGEAREARTAQSEEAWRQVKATYKPKKENGDYSAAFEGRLHRIFGGPLKDLAEDYESPSARDAVADNCQTYFKIYKRIKLPLQKSVGKMEAREVLFAVEELYFFRRFGEAVTFLEELFQDDGAAVLEQEVRKTLIYYRRKCEEGLKSQETTPETKTTE